MPKISHNDQYSQFYQLQKASRFKTKSSEAKSSIISIESNDHNQCNKVTASLICLNEMFVSKNN